MAKAKASTTTDGSTILIVRVYSKAVGRKSLAHDQTVMATDGKFPATKVNAEVKAAYDKAAEQAPGKPISIAIRTRPRKL